MSKQRKTIEEEFIEFGIPEVNEKGEELTKSARKKLLTKAKKDAKKTEISQKQQAQAKQKGPEEDTSAGKYGVLPIIRSQERANKNFARVQTLSAANKGETVLVRGRIQSIRTQARFIFVTVRQQCHTIQAISMKPNSPQMMAFIKKAFLESIVDIEGTLQVPEAPVQSTTQQDIEIHISSFWIVNASEPTLPLFLEDAERSYELVSAQKKEIRRIEAEITATRAKLESSELSEEDRKSVLAQVEKLVEEKSSAQKFVVVGKATRLNNRVIDLRTQSNQAVFRIQSGVCQLYREFLSSNQFVEIHTPKLIGTASEGGADVFQVGYFGRNAFLAQSPQLYKQMSIMGDFDRVFEIGPVFRAEKSKTRRHLTEFVGLDLEMAILEHYHECLDLFDRLFVFLFEGLQTRFAHEIEAVRKQYPSQPFKFQSPSLRLQWPEAIALLRENGVEIGDFEDFDTATEIKLGGFIREKYNTDFYMLDRFPLAIRPFYTMPAADDERYSNSYDFFMRGQEILSGAQRIHDPSLLIERAAAKGVEESSIQDYVNSFKFGAYPHAGGGIGLERVVMLFLGLHSVQLTSMYPRTMARLTP